MIRKVTGSSHLYPYSYAPQIRDAVRRPLFAMLVASLYGTNGSTPRTSSGLIRHCAMRSLERSIGSWRESFPLLRKIAASSIMNDGSVSLAEFGGEAMRDKLQETRLVSISSHKVSFTLSLFEQWFAAEALLQKEVKLENIIADLVTFSKWRYVLALSVQTGSEAQIDEIITKLAAWNPGASAWVVKEGIERPFVAGSSSSELPSWKVVATRLHRTMGAWGAGLGLLAPIATPVDAGKNIADHVRLHLSVEETGKRFNYAWEVKERDSQGVSHLSKPQDLIARGIGPGSSPSLSGDGWVWSWTLHSMQQRIGVNLLNTLHLHVPLDGVIETEHIWAVVYSILRRGSFLRADPVEASALDGLVRKLQQDAFAFGPVDSYAYRFGRRDVTRLDLLLIREWLSRQTESVLTPPWPAADVSRPPSGWVWNFYTPERLLELTRHVYSRALDAYSEMSRTLFSRFGFTLGHATLMPATLKGQLRMGEGNGFSDGPVLEYSLIPLADSEAIENIVDITLASSNGPRFFQEDDINSAYFRRYYLDNPERAPFSWHGVTSTALHIWESRPATRIAFQWLWADLKALGWVTGLPSDVK
ncbi:hypothetical protein GR131_14575 [Streptomyces sp. GF20]|uniref:hypothetical protein n=1 Tax=Streptomyces sp. GF20 TaxID=2692235 RepID=UPI001317EB3E|nr:hypothetical protein [Streptomyces sp. GF20]QHC16583.1 hypothetical protein GR131_14575 [Streptomyces sp. GF20]